jgi:hypothetical protein
MITIVVNPTEITFRPVVDANFGVLFDMIDDNHEVVGQFSINQHGPDKTALVFKVGGDTIGAVADTQRLAMGNFHHAVDEILSNFNMVMRPWEVADDNKS